MAIRAKLLLVFLVLSLGPLALVGFLAYESGRRALEGSRGAVFELHASRAIETLDREARMLRQSVEAWTDLELMHDVLNGDPDGRVSAFLIEQARSTEGIALALVAGAQGTVVAASRPEWLGQTVTTLAPTGLDGNACVDAPLGSMPDGSPQVTCRFPIPAAFDAERVIGRLYVTLDLGPTIRRLEEEDEETVDRSPDDMFFVGRDGGVIARSQPAPEGSPRQELDPSGAQAVRLAAQGRSGFLVERLGQRDHLVGYAHSSGATGWSVLVARETRDAFAPVYRLGLVIFGFATVLAALVVVLSLVAARRVTSPILGLTEAAQRVGRGDLEPSLPPTSQDEIGALIEGFAHMVEELRAKRAQLVKKEYLDSIVSNMVDGLVVLDASEQILTTNPALHDLAGRSAADLVGRPVATLLAEGEEGFRERVLEPVRRERAVRGVELGLVTSSGATVPVRLSAGAVPAGPGGSGAIVCILTDITQWKRAEAALVRAREEAEAGARAKARFLATMSHEIRTPLNGIIGMMELLASSQLDPKQLDYAETAQHSGEALLAIVGDILDYSKLDAGGVELESLEFDPRASLEGIADALAPRAREKSLELTVVCDPALPARVRGDERRLRQVLLNLGSNAVKFTSHGHVLLRAGPEPARPSQIRFEVVDTGIGIPAEGRERLFRPFSQVDASTTRKYGGTGLGLAISSQLVELMGGEIGLETEEGRGSTFWLSVPLPTVEAPRESVTAGLGALRVLVVDDNETNRRVVCEMLERWGCRSTEATDGWEALQVLRAAAEKGAFFDLALVDFQMPEMDGAQLAAEIKQDKRLASLPLALLTSIPQHAQTAQRMGFEVCLTKPIKGSALLQAIEACLPPVRERPRQPLASSPSPPDQSPMNQGRVLVVDDDATSRKVAVALLEQAGCRCDTAASGVAALAALDHESYEIVFMDCHMPQMDGYEATRRIREEHDRQERLVIVAMTGDAFAEDRERSLAAGMNDHVAKPVRRADIDRILARYLPGKTRQPSRH